MLKPDFSVLDDIPVQLWTGPILSKPPIGSQFLIPSSVTAQPVDADGLVVPPPFGFPAAHEQPATIAIGWMRLLPKMRRERSERWVADQIAAANAPKIAAAKRSPATRFSTRQAIEWGRKQGWSVLAVEEDRAYQGRDGRWKRITADLRFGMDVLFRVPGVGVVAVQAAGKSERKAHWERFIGRGGHERAHEAYDAVLYVEFERGKPEPIWQECWIGKLL